MIKYFQLHVHDSNDFLLPLWMEELPFKTSGNQMM
jgi:hypothetical protein